MNRKAIVSVATVAGALATAISASAAQAAGVNGWYGGAALGASQQHLGGGQIDGALGNQGLAGASSIDKSATSLKLFGGYQFNPNFALEGGYVNLGKFDYNSAISSPAADTVNGHLGVMGIDAAAVGMLPLNEQWSVFGKAGAFYAKTTLDASSGGAVNVNEASHWGTSPLLGAGVSYDITRKVALRAEWDRYFRVGDTDTTGRGDIDQLTAGVVYRFE
jgi:OOP family OmpA-OmpF porin